MAANTGMDTLITAANIVADCTSPASAALAEHERMHNAHMGEATESTLVLAREFIIMARDAGDRLAEERGFSNLG